MPMPRAAKAIPLARDSHIAMYRQIAARLRGAIAQGVYKPGEKIPAELQLMHRFAVSHITVRQAVDALVKEGPVIRQQGKKGKDRKFNGVSGSMADAGCSHQSPLSGWHASQFAERPAESHLKHCLIPGCCRQPTIDQKARVVPVLY